MKYCLSIVALLLLTQTAMSQPTMVEDFRPGASGSNPFWLTEYDGNLVFTANDGTTGSELYQYDGSSISLLEDVEPGPVSGGITRLHAHGTLLFFRANAQVMGSYLGDEPWVYDGTSAYNVKDINPAGGVASSPQYFASFNGYVYFSANNGSNGVEVWRSDGTESGTALQTDIWPGVQSSNPTGFIVYEGNLYFGASDAMGNGQLYEINPAGVISNTIDFEPVAWLAPIPFDILGGELYVYGSDLTTGSELWRTDGTEANSFLVEDINPGIASSTIGVADGHAVMGGYLYFRANDGTSGYELWRTDGATTEMVVDIDPAGSSFPDDFAVLDNMLFFSATTPDAGVELWMSDGTGAGTMRVADINPGTDGSNPQHMTVYNGELYFNADDGVNGPELWKYSTTLPVTLAELGVSGDGRETTVYWTTESETKLAGFGVERSEGDEGAFESLGYVDAVAPDGLGSEYQFSDSSLWSGHVALYRLKMINDDGSFVYSQTVEIQHQIETASLRIYPNPVVNTATFKIATPRSGNISVELFDTLGRNVATVFDGHADEGSITKSLEMSGLPSGMYVARMRVGTHVVTVPMVAVR